MQEAIAECGFLESRKLRMRSFRDMRDERCAHRIECRMRSQAAPQRSAHQHFLKRYAAFFTAL
jgi:hypothetical protein